MRALSYSMTNPHFGFYSIDFQVGEGESKSAVNVVKSWEVFMPLRGEVFRCSSEFLCIRAFMLLSNPIVVLNLTLRWTFHLGVHRKFTWRGPLNISVDNFSIRAPTVCLDLGFTDCRTPSF